jgi:hypothetical protein
VPRGTSRQARLPSPHARTILFRMERAPHQPPTIDVTLDGTVLPEPGLWSRAARLWRALPPGSVPALLLLGAAFCALALVLLGLLVVAVPVLIVLSAVSLVLRSRRFLR